MSTGVYAAAPPKDAVVLIKDGISDYHIVIPDSPTPAEKKAAEELQKDLKTVSGAYLPITSDRDFPQEKEIILGHSKRLDDIGLNVNLNQFDTDGFSIRTVGKKLVIVGGVERGVLYGVYTFLEDIVGCRWFAADQSFYPDKKTIAFNKLNLSYTPKIFFRNIYYAEARDPEFCAHQKITSNYYTPLLKNIKSIRLKGSFNFLCHTVFSFVPPDEFFKTHPEYYSMRDGKRTPSQLCLTNPDLEKIVVERLKKAFEKNPGFLYCNVSQMDNGEPCTCEACKALDEKEGGFNGTNFAFANKIAKHFPDKIITTLVYWYTFGPAPKTFKIEKNVLPIFCADTNNRPPVSDYLKSWTAATKTKWHWYYVNPCHNCVAPWPNLYMLERDIRNWTDNNMTGMFVEGINEACSEFAELRTYLLAKLLWNPKESVDKHIKEFVSGYYGDAAPFIQAYIDEMHKAVVDTDDTLDTHQWSRDHAGTFLTPQLLARYDELFSQAEKAVEYDPVMLKRVHKAHIPLMHAELQLNYGSVDQRIALLETMKKYAHEVGLKFFADFGGRPTDTYLAEVLAGLNKEKAGK
jgi:hypothetical protein